MKILTEKEYERILAMEHYKGYVEGKKDREYEHARIKSYLQGRIASLKKEIEELKKEEA